MMALYHGYEWTSTKAGTISGIHDVFFALLNYRLCILCSVTECTRTTMFVSSESTSFLSTTSPFKLQTISRRHSSVIRFLKSPRKMSYVEVEDLSSVAANKLPISVEQSRPNAHSRSKCACHLLESNQELHYIDLHVKHVCIFITLVWHVFNITTINVFISILTV